jgi:hypothetical protein
VILGMLEEQLRVLKWYHIQPSRTQETPQPLIPQRHHPRRRCSLIGQTRKNFLR